MPVTTIIKNATIFGFHPWPYWTEVQESLFTGFPCLQERTKKHRGKKNGKRWWYRTGLRGWGCRLRWIFVSNKDLWRFEAENWEKMTELTDMYTCIYIYIYMFFIHISYIHICWGLFIYIYIHIYTEYIWVAQLQTRLVLKGWLFEMVISNLAT